MGPPVHSAPESPEWGERLPEPTAHPDPTALAAALAMLPEDHFLMTAAFEGQRSGVRLRSVQRCADEPILLAVAARKGHAIDPLIRDSRSFAICLIDADDRLLARSFPEAEAEALPGEGDPEHDPFDAIPTRTLVTGSPVINRCRAAFDCEVVRHVDLEADHELFVGHVLAVKIFRA